jgi:hypothetical protein
MSQEWIDEQNVHHVSQEGESRELQKVREREMRACRRSFINRKRRIFGTNGEDQTGKGVMQ